MREAGSPWKVSVAVDPKLIGATNVRLIANKIGVISGNTGHVVPGFPASGWCRRGDTPTNCSVRDALQHLGSVDNRRLVSSRDRVPRRPRPAPRRRRTGIGLAHAGNRRRGGYALWWFGFALVVVLLAWLSLFVGARPVSAAQVWDALFAYAGSSTATRRWWSATASRGHCWRSSSAAPSVWPGPHPAADA